MGTDARSGALEKQANELLEKVDSLGQVNAKSPPECSRLQALEAASLELQATVRAKATPTAETHSPRRSAWRRSIRSTCATATATL